MVVDVGFCRSYVWTVIIPFPGVTNHFEYTMEHVNITEGQEY